MRLSAAGFALALGVAAALHAQTPAPVITITFQATTDDGAPVNGLTPADVRLKVGGRDRTIRSLEAVTVAEGVSSPAAVAPSSALPAPFGETIPAADRPGRSILLLIDEGTLFGLEPVVRDAVTKLVASLSPADRLGVVSTRAGGISVPMTSQHQTVKAAVDAHSLGRGNPSLCFGGVAREVLSVAQLLPAAPSSMLAVLSRGGGIASSQGAGATFSSGECMIRRDQLLPLANAISSTQVSYHVFNVSSAGRSPALDDLAGSTGADTSLLSFADATSLTDFVQSLTHFYRATIDAEGSSDRLERVELRVERPNVEIKAPSHMSLRPMKAAAVDAADLLRGEASRADLPIRVTAFPSRNDGARPARLLVAVEPAERGTQLMEVIVSLVSTSGEVAGQWTARPADLAQLPLMAALPVMPGTYRVRVAAVDHRGRAGLAEYQTGTLQQAGPVQLSGLVLGAGSGGQFLPRLLFTDEPAATAYLEIYDAPSGADVHVTFELSGTADGPASAQVPAKVSAGATRTAIGQIPLGSVPTGDTIVRAVVTVNGTRAGQAVRTLRKSSR